QLSGMKIKRKPGAAGRLARMSIGLGDEQLDVDDLGRMDDGPRHSVPDDRKTGDEIDHAIRQIISNALVSAEVVDIFATAGLKKPDISILSDEFLTEVRVMLQGNLA